MFGHGISLSVLLSLELIYFYSLNYYSAWMLFIYYII